MRDSRIRFICQQGYPAPSAGSGWYEALTFQPKVVGILAALGAAWQSPTLFLALSAVLWWNALVPAANPFDAIYDRLVLRARGLPAPPPAPLPRRFAQGMAGTLAFVIGAALILNVTTLAWIVEGLFIVAAAEVVFGDFCSGAALFNAGRSVLMRGDSKQETGCRDARRRGLAREA